MNTNTENLEAAKLFWEKQAIAASTWPTYVVAQPTGLRVLADNMAVMLAGCCKPLEFTSAGIAIIHEKKLAAQMWDFDGEPQLEMMPFDVFCGLQITRFETALQAARVADAMARQMVAA